MSRHIILDLVRTILGTIALGEMYENNLLGEFGEVVTGVLYFVLILWLYISVGTRTGFERSLPSLEKAERKQLIKQYRGERTLSNVVITAIAIVVGVVVFLPMLYFRLSEETCLVLLVLFFWLCYAFARSMGRDIMKPAKEPTTVSPTS